MKPIFLSLLAAFLLSSLGLAAAHVTGMSQDKKMTQGQAVIDGMMGYKSDGTAKITIEGAAAKVLFLEMSDNRITSIEPTDSCKQIVLKSGDHIECSHCNEREKRMEDVDTYWCALSLDMRVGKVLTNPIFGSAAH